jgi:UDP-N-acetylmuramate dehydrogenase
MNFPKAFKNKVKKGEFLRHHTTFGIGGEALGWYEPLDSRELSGFLKCLPKGADVFAIGAGSNLLARDGRVRKIFIRFSKPFFRRIDISGVRVRAGAGVSLGALARALVDQGLTGHEFLSGIPGTLGGAVVMNAGARTVFDDPGTYREIKDIVEDVEVMDRRGRVRILGKDRITFSYRHSSLGPLFILAASLKLRRGSVAQGRKMIARIQRERRTRQELSYPSAGSFFKNPRGGDSAGRLIDLCGLKGACVGGACVSSRHANFIVNKGGATCDDVMKLMEIIRKTVYNRYKIRLHPEVKIVG